MATPITLRRPLPRLSTDPARQNRESAPLAARETALGTVGYTDPKTELPEGTPAWAFWEQGEILVETTLEDGDQIVARLACPCTLTFGQTVALLMPNGDPNRAVIVAALHNAIEPAPASVAGVETGARDATARGTKIPAATWQFVRLDDGRMLGIQTNDSDILIHAGAGVHIRSTAGAIHLDGACYLGAAPATPPMGSEVGEAGEEIPGVTAVSHVPTPYSAPGPPGPETLPVPYVGLESGLVRASDIYQITAVSDPGFFAYLALLAAGAGVPDPPPTAINARISGVAGAGSRHTAEGDVGE